MMLYKSRLVRNTEEKLYRPKLTDNGNERVNQEKNKRMICHSMEFHMPVTISYADKGTALLMIGYIHFFTETDHYIKVVDKFGHIEAIPVESIIDIQYLID
ncbi:YolD-like family protein [Bacillus infantis]|uniref:YolD-like family protein n=1 Tax=Bacillus infantis TaxID=324767 RepID=A0A5D4SAD6_9BACI|nr:YolD-like family protein [Bacillus infantis]TYS60607.1 YolD-like family protein [Bacillus infantis]